MTRVDGKLGDPPVVFGLDDGSLAAAWMPYVKGGKSQYAADIYLARSQDGCSNWSPAFKPYGKSARIYDAQMSLTPLPGARIALVWTDMRDAGHKKNDRYRLMATVLAKNQRRAGKETTLDGDVCSCCRVYTAAQDELRIAKVEAGGISRQTIIYRGDFPKWPSKYPGMVRLGKQAFVAWTDPEKNKVRLAAVALD